MDTEPQGRPGGGDDLERSSALSDRRQRRILAILLDSSRPIPVHELSVQLVARAADIDPADVSEADRQSVRMDLRHRCLPMLESVGWIDRQPAGVVAVDGALSFEMERLSPPPLRDPDNPFWEVVSTLLARPYRQDLVAAVADRSQPVALESLATELLARGGRASSAFADDRRLSIALHHIDLPKLASLGMFEYDPEARTVARTDQLLRFADWSNLDTA